VCAVRRWASDGVDLVLDAVGLDTLLPHAVDVVKPGGSFVEIETLISQASERQMSVAAAKGVRIVSNMVAINRLPEHLAKLALLYADGMAVPPAIELIPLGEVADAHARVQQGHVRGKIALQISAPATW
jgi:D-arabinose 1-dehydrogenase-like Zn-dependent alcohol dehydrogenase